MGQALDTFLHDVNAGTVPHADRPLLKAVWHGLRGEWEAAHVIAQEDESPLGSWVHGWLHRIEGDLGNAGYWYRRAHRPVPTNSPNEEGQAIARALLRDPS